MSELVEICEKGLKTVEGGKVIPWENIKLVDVINYMVQEDYLGREKKRAEVNKSALKEAEERGFPYVVVKYRGSEHTHGLSGQTTKLLSVSFNFYIDISFLGSK